IDRFKAAVVRKVLTSPLFRRGPKTLRNIGALSYEEAFDELFALMGDRLRLPASDFIADRVLLVAGSLGPGGAERQIAYTAAGIAQLRRASQSAPPPPARAGRERASITHPPPPT